MNSRSIGCYFSYPGIRHTQKMENEQDCHRHNHNVVDQFAGHKCTFEKQYHGQIFQYFKLNSLFHFEFTVLAHMVHEANPKYSILNTQCYFYAVLVYAAAKNYTKVLVSESADKFQSQVPLLQSPLGGQTDIETIQDNTLSTQANDPHQGSKLP
jgi:hypothetical protein